MGREKLDIASGAFATATFAKAATWTDTVDQTVGLEKKLHMGNAVTLVDVEPENLSAFSAVSSLQDLSRCLVFAYTDHATPTELLLKVQFARKTGAGFETPVGLTAVTPGTTLDSSTAVVAVDDIWHNGGVPRLIDATHNVDIDDNLFCLCTVSPTATTAAGVIVVVTVVLVPSLAAPVRQNLAGNIYSAATYK